MKKVTHYEKLTSEKVRCLLCPIKCKLDPGKRGVCGTRKNREGVLISLVYELVASIAVDPIEKKPVFHYKPGSNVLSLGSVGCNLRCKHCQNWELSQSILEEVNTKRIKPETLVQIAKETDSQGVAWTYNEPTIWWDYIMESAPMLKEKGFYTVMVTNGFINEAPLKELLPFIDVYRIDIKAFFRDSFQFITGLSEVAIPLRSSVLAREKGKHVEVVTNVIPTVNDGEKELREISKFIKKELGHTTPWHITRFFPYYHLSHFPATPTTILIKGREIGYEEGLLFVYLGNIHIEGGEDTICPRCKKAVIERVGFKVVSMKVDSVGRCELCGEYLNISC